jgi:hypothetical protein
VTRGLMLNQTWSLSREFTLALLSDEWPPIKANKTNLSETLSIIKITQLLFSILHLVRCQVFLKPQRLFSFK